LLRAPVRETGWEREAARRRNAWPHPPGGQRGRPGKHGPDRNRPGIL